ncbi:MAG: hypothetical protein R3E14_00710 [Erythrobacter sp.]
MKPIFAHTSGAIALTAAAAACVPAPDSTPAPSPTPVVIAPAPTPTPTPVAAAPAFESWIDAPQSAGEWRYILTSLGGAASFGTSQDKPDFTLWCDRTRRQVELVRHSDASAPRMMVVRTETAERQFTAQSQPNRPQRLVVTLSASDPLLDAMALTRGRFAVETAELPTLYLPPWGEFVRAIEDCR